MSTVFDLTKLFGQTTDPKKVKVIAHSTGHEASPSSLIDWVPGETFDVEFVSKSAFGLLAPALPGWEGNIYYATSRSGSEEEWTHTVHANETCWAGQSLTANDDNWYLYLRGIGNTKVTGGYSGQWQFKPGASGQLSSVSVIGSIEALLDYKKMKAGEHVVPGEAAFAYMFADSRIDHDFSKFRLACEQLSPRCYEKMFVNNVALTSRHLPSFPAVIMSEECCASMFENCTALTNVPEFSATSMAARCYYRMFANCTSLVTGPEKLPAIKLAPGCYNSMFYRCYSLAKMPALPAEILADSCYRGMFERCTSLGNEGLSALPATKLAHGCYDSMFQGCTGLTDLSSEKMGYQYLSADELAIGCYNSMFYGCSALKKAPELPATKMMPQCYCQMFQGCTSLEETPALPSTELNTACYAEMFQGCTKLKKPATLPALVLVNNCYERMFAECSNICLSENEPLIHFGKWGLPNPTSMMETSIHQMFLDTGGEVQDTFEVGKEYWLGEAINYVTFSSPNPFKITVANPQWTNDLFADKGLYYESRSGSGSWWVLWSYDELHGAELEATKYGERYIINLRGKKQTHIGGTADGCNFVFSSSSGTPSNITVSGNMESLLDCDVVAAGGHPTMDLAGFQNLFLVKEDQISAIVNARNLRFPAINLPAPTDASTGAYANLFKGCATLSAAPRVLPARTVPARSYYYMFDGCTNLVLPPAVRATSVGESAMEGMCKDCGNLDYIVDLDTITTLAPSCFKSMFEGCSSISRLSNLPCKVLPDHCYERMFYGCGVVLYTEETTGCRTWRVPSTGDATTTGTDYMREFLNSTSTIVANTTYWLAQSVENDLFLRLYSDAAFTMTVSTIGAEGEIQYSTDLNNWYKWEIGTPITATNTCIRFPGVYNLFFRGIGNTIVTGYTGATVDMTGSAAVHADTTCGSVECLLDYAKVQNGEHPAVGEYAFNNLFANCTILDTAPALFQSLADRGCSADNDCVLLAKGCYQEMFKHCTALTNPPTMNFNIKQNPDSGITIPESVCESMFINCTSLQHAYPLVSTYGTCDDHNGKAAFKSMYQGCTKLESTMSGTTRINLKNTDDLGEYGECYAYMFKGAGTDLTNGFEAPDILSTSLSQKTCSYMFEGAKISRAPVISATSVGLSACEYMYSQTTGLDVYPDFNVTTCTGQAAFKGTFYKNTAITRAPALPLTQLMGFDCQEMFKECTSLKTVCMSPANELKDDSYVKMYSGCSNLAFSRTRTSEYCITYRIPTSGSATGSTSSAVMYMFENTNTPMEDDALSGVSILEKEYYMRDPDRDLLCFTSAQDGSAVGFSKSDGIECNIFYKTQKSGVVSGWSTYEWGYPVYIDHVGDKVWFKGTGWNPGAGSGASVKCNTHSVPGQFAASGSIMSLIDGTGESTVISKSKQFLEFFKNITALTTAPALPATTLTESCYQGMFEGCTNLITAPALPATGTMPKSCYQGMFKGCKNLGSLPGLPATTLGDSCYKGMFENCSEGTTGIQIYTTSAESHSKPYRIPILQQGTMQASSVTNMFNGCLTDLTGGTPAINTTYYTNKQVDGAYLCLTNVSGTAAAFTVKRNSNGSLPTRDLKASSDGIVWDDVPIDASLMIAKDTKIYFKGNNPDGFNVDLNNNYIFQFEKDFTVTGNIMALVDNGRADTFTIPNSGCFCRLFEGSGVTTAPYLPATALKSNCYQNLFKSCKSLEVAPVLSATTLAESCYQGMFSGCTALTAPPELMATSLAASCYEEMFSGCTALNVLPLLPATTVPNNSYKNMFNDCANVMLSLTQVSEYQKPYKVPSTGTSWILGTDWNTSMFKSTGGTWPGSGGDGSPEEGRTYYTANDITPVNYLTFTASGSGMSIGIEKTGTQLSPNIEYSLDRETWNTYTPELPAAMIGFTKIYFRGNNPDGFACTTNNYLTFKINGTGTVAASGDLMSLISPYGSSEIPCGSCFYRLFFGCNKLTSAPELPATVLKDGCYSNLFNACRALTAPPALPATELKPSCYLGMLANCDVLATAPELPATTMAERCYESMFYGCKALTTPPALPATTLAGYCYYFMFQACTALTTLPSISAKTFPENCCHGMFSGCSNIKLSTTQTGEYVNRYRLPIEGTGTEGSYSLTNMFYDTGGTFTGTPEINIDYWTSNAVIPYRGLTFTANTDNSKIGITKTGTPTGTSFSYSRDGKTWTSYTPAETNAEMITLEHAGDKIYFKGNNPNGINKESNYCKFVMDGSIAASGNIMSLIDNGSCNTTTIPGAENGGCFLALFYGCSALTTAPALPATTLTKLCYYEMFSSCTSLTTAPELPATTLTDSCYYSMFAGCTALTAAPALPATTLADYCYQYMFLGCTSLTTAPALQATTMTSSCYNGMFNGCTSLTTAPALPATTLAAQCYLEMFSGCTSLTTPPVLPAMTMKDFCYAMMFKDCTSLTTPPELPATTLATRCYFGMFWNCSALEALPLLPAIEMIMACYYQMFQGCSKITLYTAPQGTCNYPYRLPAAGTGQGTAASVWNGWMFKDCLTDFGDAPEINTTYYTSARVTPCKCLCFTAKQAGSKIGMYSTHSGGEYYYPDLSYSTDEGKTWAKYDVQGAGMITLANAGDKIYWRGENGRFSYSQEFYTFKMEGNFTVSGNIMSLFDNGACNTTEFPVPAGYDKYHFFKLFYDCAALTDASELELPAITLTESCYSHMFWKCTNLTSPPKLPATTLAKDCYEAMFAECKKLVKIPSLPATHIKNGVYGSMFYGCSLIKLSETQTGEYVNAYRIPTSGSAVVDPSATSPMYQMFKNTSGTWPGSGGEGVPTIEKTYYTSNTVINP